MSAFLSSYCPDCVSSAVSSVVNFLKCGPCRRPSRPSPGTQEKYGLMESLKKYGKNKVFNACSDTLKVNFQRWCNLHLIKDRIAYALLGEIVSPVYTISSSSGKAITSIKNELRKAIAIIRQLLDRYQLDHGDLPHVNDKLSEYEYVAQNLSFLQDHFEIFVALGLRQDPEDLEVPTLLSLPEQQLQEKMDSAINFSDNPSPQGKEHLKTLKTLLDAYLLTHNEAPAETSDEVVFVQHYLPRIEEHFDEFKTLALSKALLMTPQGQLEDKIHSIQQIKAFFHYALGNSLLWTLGMSSLIASVPYIYDAAGNHDLMDTQFVSLFFALSPLTTVFTTMNNSMMEAFSPFLQNRLASIEWIRDFTQMAASYVGLKMQNPFVIILGQVIPSFFTGVIGYYMLRRLFRQLNTHLPLSDKQKKYMREKIRSNILGTGAQAGFRILVPFFLGLLHRRIAVFAYNVFYFQNWGLMGIIRSVAGLFSYGRGIAGYEDHADTLDKCLSWSNSSLSFLLALLIFGLKDVVIPGINSPDASDPVEANNIREANAFVSEWWPLGCVTLSFLGWSMVQQDKIGNVYDLRWPVTFMTVLPPFIGFVALFDFGGGAQVLGVVGGWLCAALITIAYGHCSSRVRGEVGDRFAQARRANPPSTNTVPLLEENVPVRRNAFSINLSPFRRFNRNGYAQVSTSDRVEIVDMGEAK